MDKFRCELCLKSFANGKALGGHMRSHMVNLCVPPKSEQQQQSTNDCRLGEEIAESASFSSSSDAEEEENEDKLLLGYELRENPKKSVRLVDPRFSESVVIIQDRESETESSQNPTRRRSKRIRKLAINSNHHQLHYQNMKMKKPKRMKPESEPEPVSSISDFTPDEDVAYCLMMLSRDKWMTEKETEEEEEETEDSIELNNNKKKTTISKARVRGKYKCETCHRLFRSYQALGGHRASHKKTQAIDNGLSIREQSEIEVRNEEKIHECPVCYRVFSSGQALGGHKRSHVMGSANTSSIPPPTTTTTTKPPLKSGEKLIDLNLPAPIEDDDDDGDEISQIEFSAVSDAEFVNPIKR